MLFKNCVLSLIALSLFAMPPLSFAADKPLTAERPKDESFRTALNKETSTLSIPVELSTDELARVLNQTISKDLYKGSTKTRGVAADVVRNGPIVVTAADNFLYITLPIAMTLSYGMYELKPIPLKLKFKATAGVTPDWQLNTIIYYQGLSDLVVEDVGMGPLSFKPRSIIEGITQPIQKPLSDMISQKINDLLPLKAQITKVWNTAQKPILIDKKYNAWLRLTPQEVMLYPLYAQKNMVRLNISINTLAEMVTGAEPAAEALRPLPNLKLVNTFDKTFRIVLNADLFYKDLRAIAIPLLLNKKFDSDGKSILIKGFDLYGNGDKLVVKLETEGSLDGLFYLTARPMFNVETGMFSVEDVDFDMQTQSMLLKTADWFLHGTIRGMIKEKLNTNMTQQLEQSRQMAGKALARIQLMDKVFLKCDIKNLKFKDAIVQQDKISIQVYTEGESAISFQ